MDVERLWATLTDRMHSDDRHRLSWSVRYDRTSAVEQAPLEELIDVCKEACSAEFPTSEGYATTVRRLSGPIEGASITIARGNFSALVSVQRYTRGEATTAAELRLVASCRHEQRVLAIANDDGPARWGLAGCALGTMGAGSAGLELSGLLTAWGHMLLLIPALVAWKICMAMRGPATRDEGRPHALPEDPAVTRAQRRTRRQDERRWRRLHEVLLAQREVVVEQSTLRPFRIQGAQSGRGLRPASMPLALPPRVLPVPSLPV